MKRRWLFLLPAIAGVLGVVTLYKAARATRQAKAEVAAAKTIGFKVRKLDRHLPAFESIPSAGMFADAAVFDHRIYISTPSALLEYDAGASRRSWRAGLDLPSAALASLAVVRNELYVATNGAGFLIFDGAGFRQVLPDDPACRKITAILPLAGGRILLGTATRGVLSYNGRHLSPFHDSLNRLEVTALAGDLASVWIGTMNHGVYHWDAGTLTHFAEADGLPDPQVTSLIAAGGRAFVGTPMGIAEFRDGRLARRLAPGFFANALLATGDKLLAGGMSEGIVEIPLAAHRPRPARQPGALPSTTITKLFVAQTFMSAAPRFILASGDSQNQPTLAALSAGGLYTAEKPRSPWKQALAPEPEKLTDRNISALALDTAGRLWVGYFDRGLDVLDGDRVHHFEDDTVFCVNRILPNPATQTIAVATANGLALFDAGLVKRQVLRRADGLLADHVTDIALRRDAMLLATPAGITTIDSAGTHSVSAFHGLVNPHVYTIAAQGDEVLAGTLGGLSILRGGTVQASYTTFNSRLRHNWITAIQPVAGEWFVGTYGAGVMRLTASGDWDAFPSLQGPIVINPNAMLVTPSHVFAGSLENGLLVYDRATERWITVQDGLPSANVTALAASGGTIWIGTDNGLVRIAEDKIQ